jgi:hypothetical protein
MILVMIGSRGRRRFLTSDSIGAGISAPFFSADPA